MNWSGWWIHLLLYPVYQTLGTLRHELTHMLTAKILGGDILMFRVWPGFVEDEFRFGYVRYVLPPYEREQNQCILMMPYLVAFLSMVIWFGWIHELNVFSITSSFWLAFAAMSMLVSPAVDVAWNLFKWWKWNRGDFAHMKDYCG